MTPAELQALREHLHWHQVDLIRGLLAAVDERDTALRRIATALGNGLDYHHYHRGPAGLATEIERRYAGQGDLVETIICSPSVGAQDRAAHPEERQ